MRGGGGRVDLCLQLRASEARIVFVIALAVREHGRQERHCDSAKHAWPSLTAGPAGGMEKGPVMPADVLLAQGTFSCSLCEVFPDLEGAGQSG